jgi:DNA-binding response OmpR family regulator
VRVLVVEDSRALADVVVEGLRDEGIVVDVAYDGLEAVTKLDLNTYDVVVLDRDLPRVHGDTICRMITERENPAMVLMLTASVTPAQRVSGLRLEADDYLPKPSYLENASSASGRLRIGSSPSSRTAMPPGRCGPFEIVTFS